VLLGFDPDTPTITNGYAGDHGLPGLFRQLMVLPDAAVLDILSVVMGDGPRA
jgi:ParB family chromosome partitioning protein